MVTINLLEDTLLLAKAYYVEQLSTYRLLIVSGGLDNPPYKMKYLGALIKALEPDVIDGIISENTRRVYAILLKEIANYTGSASINPNIQIPGLTINIIDNSVTYESQLNYARNTQVADGETAVFYIAHGYTQGGVPTVPPYYGVDGQDEDSQDGTFNVGANTTNLILTYTGIYPLGNITWEYRVSKPIQ